MSGRLFLDLDGANAAKERGKTAGDGFAAAALPFVERSLDVNGHDAVSSAARAALAPVAATVLEMLKVCAPRVEGNHESAARAIGSVLRTDEGGATAIGAAVGEVAAGFNAVFGNEKGPGA